jgi:hypothetical protein
VGFVVAFGCVAAGPAVIAVATADAIVGGSMVAGLLGAGSAAGAVTGMHITETAQWKGKKR